MSRAFNASYISRPKPGQDVTCSTMKDPDSSAPTATPNTAQIGRNDTGQACRHKTSDSDAPRAEAAVRNGCPVTSPSACDCSRSKTAAAGSASASVGSSRCQPRSTSQAPHVMDAAAVDDMPPTGNQPVRAAISTSTNEVTSGGTDTNNSDSAR